MAKPATAATTTATTPSCTAGNWYCFDAGSVISAALHIAVILVIAFVLRYLVHRVINRLVRRSATGAGLPFQRLRGRARELLEFTDEIPVVNERREQRAQAVGSVLRSIASAFILGTAFVMVLQELSLNIAPVLTSAGILGVAVGFGAQNLVRDFLSGIFMILEDQYGVGDVIDAGPASGAVEAVGLRTTRLRSVDGTVWHVRNGSIDRVGNMSQNWSRVVIDVQVAYGADVEAAVAVIEQAARAAVAREDLAAVVLDEPEVWGVEHLGPDGIDVRVVVRTKPLEQWRVARAVRAEIKAAFDRAGLEIPFPQRTVWLRERAPEG